MEGIQGMEEAQVTKGAGLLDAVARVLRELLRTPRFKQAVKILLNSVDPGSAPELARILVWEDPDLFLSLLSTLPRILNALIRLAQELAVQLENFTPELLDAYLGRLLEELDGESLGEGLGRAVSLAGRVGEAGREAREAASHLREEVARGYSRGRGAEAPESPDPLAVAALGAISTAVRGLLRAAGSGDNAARREALSFVRSLAEAVRENPEAARELVEPLLEAWKEGEGAS